MEARDLSVCSNSHKGVRSHTEEDNIWILRGLKVAQDHVVLD